MAKICEYVDVCIANEEDAADVFGIKASDTDAFDTVGADRAWDDGLQDEDVLLAPAPFDALYPHLLCAQMDAALGETDRYAGEQAQYNALYAELAVWLRQNYPPRSRAQWRW